MEVAEHAAADVDGAAVDAPLTAGDHAKILADGTAEAPDAATAVQNMIAASNRIDHYPYSYAGGHGGGDGQILLQNQAPASTTLESIGDPGAGRWVTIYANADHAYIEVAASTSTPRQAKEGHLTRPTPARGGAPPGRDPPGSSRATRLVSDAL